MASKQEVRQALTEAFQAFDLDGSGSINASELKNVLCKFLKETNKPVNQSELDEQIQVFVKHVDKNKDGKVDLPEFLNFFEDLLAKY